MNPWYLSQIATMSGGSLVGEDLAVSEVCTDSRTASSQGLFVALQGEHFDGHAFIRPELQAAAVMVSREMEDARPQIVVDDTLKGLSRFAASWREKLSTRVIGITGSNGKTTVKEMVGSILSRVGPTLATKGNLNNHIGVPLTLLGIRQEHRFAVVEMGANHAGEIAALTAMARPDVAIVNNAGPAHLEGFGSLAGVARAKGEIYGGLTRAGIAVVNADDDFAEDWLALNRERQVMRFGIKCPAEVSGQFDQGRLEVMTPKGRFEVVLPLAGYHNAMNALGATAAALAAGADLDSVRLGLASMEPVAGRLRRLSGADGVLVLDDTYNANPGSLSAGLDVLTQVSGAHWLILGDMAELGEAGPELHHRAGIDARAAGVERLFTVGNLSRGSTESFGVGAAHFTHLDRLAEAVRQAAAVAPRPLTILVKGSRSMGLERVIRLLQTGENSKMPGGQDVI